MDFKKPISFNEFNKATYEDWKNQALKELKKDKLDSLLWKSKDDILLNPFYDESNSISNPSFHHQVNAPNDYATDARWWENRQEITVKDPEKDNKIILEALEGGADGVVLMNDSSTDLHKALENVKTKYCSISFITKDNVGLKPYLEYISSPEHKENVYGEIYWQDTTSAIEFMKSNSWKSLPEKIRCFGIVSQNDVKDEIASLLLSTKRLLDNIDPQQRKGLAHRFAWKISISEDYFQGLTNVRVLRNLLFQVFSAYDVNIKLQDLFIYAFSPVYINEDYGPHENILKSTTAGMAAVIGGCNSLFIQPQDSSSVMQRRVARNVSLILKEEAYLSKSMDPVAGSYFLESLLDQTSKNKWEKFQELV